MTKKEINKLEKHEEYIHLPKFIGLIFLVLTFPIWFNILIVWVLVSTSFIKILLLLFCWSDDNFYKDVMTKGWNPIWWFKIAK